MSQPQLGTRVLVSTACALGLSLTSLTTGCAPPPIVGGLETGDSGDTSDSDDTGGSGGGGSPALAINKDVDILFVIDNSGSMGEEQAILAENFASFIEVLEAPDVDANYRIGVTTTDNGNPWCLPGTTTPEGGKLVLSSCKERLDDFLFNNGNVDVQDLACNEVCTLEAEDLIITPTTTDFDSSSVARPWLESIHGVKNIPENTSTAEAFKCFGPQGINGCGFESQLESMYLSLIRAQNSQEQNYGFMRANAILAVVFVTDEADCSYNKDWSEIFDGEGSKVFWSDPTSAFPTSALCWNAGVECFGDPNNYDACEPMNYDVNGFPGASDAEAVLHPVERYRAFLDALEQEKRQFNPEQEIIVALIGGVSNDGTAFYSDVGQTDPSFQDNFGIGPGCEALNPNNPDELIQAVPPVRIRSIIDEFTPGNMFSICGPDYSDALAAIAMKIEDQLQPACYTKCVADTNPETPIVDPECTVEEDPPGQDNTVPVQECLREGGAYVLTNGDYTMPAGGINVCHVMLTDTQMHTPSPTDDMSPWCAEQNFNLEFEIVRRPGFPATSGTSLSATCSLADFPEVSCPGIGG